jgi:hypothetical protein
VQSTAIKENVMRKREALALKADAVIYERWGDCFRPVTVVEVIREATREEPVGSFPLVRTKERGVITHRLLTKTPA